MNNEAMGMSVDSVDGKGDKGKGKGKKGGKKTSKKGKNAQLETLADRLFVVMEKHKDVFFVVQLQPNVSKTKVIEQPDPNMVCELMDGRDAFLSMSRDGHHEYSSLRRTRFSTMIMLHSLHTSDTSDFSYTCNKCSENIAPMAYRYHCTNTAVCPDYDLCAACYEKEKHEHPMEKLGFGMTDDGSGATPADKKKQSIQKCIDSLVHACQCTNGQCPNPSCAKMKQVVAHTKACPTKAPTCNICKQLVALCCYHAKHCNERQCPVPFCQGIKSRLADQERANRENSRRMQERRMYMMRNQGSSGGSMAASSTPYSPQVAPMRGVSAAQPMQTSTPATSQPQPTTAAATAEHIKRLTEQLKQYQTQLTRLQERVKNGEQFTQEQQQQHHQLTAKFKSLYSTRQTLIARMNPPLNATQLEQANSLLQKLRQLTPQQQHVAMQQMRPEQKHLLQMYKQHQQQLSLQQQQRQQRKQQQLQQPPASQATMGMVPSQPQVCARLWHQ